jgi:RNA polymerase sigma-70 factor (sigma-E family)
MTATTAADPGGRVDPDSTGDSTGDKGPATTFDEFVGARSRALLRTAYLLTHDHALAEDLLQTSLAKAWFAWKRIDGEPEPYVRRILVNTYASWWRRKWKGEQPTESLPEAGVEDHAEPTDLWTAMERLPRRMRAVVVLRYFEDLTETQAADVLDCSVGTVKSQTSKALAKLRIDPALAAGDATTDAEGDPR